MSDPRPLRIQVQSGSRLVFSPSRAQARELFFSSYEKYRAGIALQGLETTALEVILLHPEYHGLLGERERNIDRDYPPESSQMNPFLHLSLHLSIEEQLAIDQPAGVSILFRKLLEKHADRHLALHIVLECLGETVWQANQSRSAPDQNAYLACLQARLNKDR